MQEYRREGSGLSEDEIAALEQVATTHVEEVISSTPGLPFIPYQIRQALLTSLALEEDFQTHVMLARIRREPVYLPIVLASQMAEDELGCIELNCREQAQAMTGWLQNQFGHNVGAKNSAAIGAMFVFKAFHLFYGGDFIDGFGRVSPESMREILNGENRALDERNSIVGRVIRGSQIPTHQFNLHFGLTKLAMCTPNEGATLDGGIAMFKVLDVNLDKMGLKSV